MLISPPFLDGTTDHTPDDDAAFVAKMMKSPGHGQFPLGSRLNWHGGVHIHTPQGLPVRAMADGIVVLVRAPEDEPEGTTASDASKKVKADRNHPQAYGGKWNSAGVVVIKHTTDIGADGDDPVSITWWSVTQHLHAIDAKVKEGEHIWRKDVLGVAGFVNGEPNCIQLEIVTDKENLDRILGPAGLTGPDASWPPGDGRSDVIFGDIFFRIPAGLPIFATDPRLEKQVYSLKQNDTPDSICTERRTTLAKLKRLNGKKNNTDEEFSAFLESKKTHVNKTIHVPATYPAHAAEARQQQEALTNDESGKLPSFSPSLPAPVPVDQDLAGSPSYVAHVRNLTFDRPVLGLTQSCIVRMHLFKDATYTTTTVDGRKIGQTGPFKDAEYNLLKTARDHYPTCASAGYDLLRFGRVLGPDKPATEDCHPVTSRLEFFQKISVPKEDGSTVEGFVDLHALGVSTWSEADFSATEGWRLIDDDTRNDARCDSASTYGAIARASLGAGYNLPALQQQLGAILGPGTRAITEWVLRIPVTPSDRQVDKDTDSKLTPRMAWRAALNKPDVQDALSRLIVHSPSEWDKEGIEARWGWLQTELDAEAQDQATKKSGPSMQADGTLDALSWAAFKAHLEAMAFWDATKIGLASSDIWRFHPVQFVQTFRRCGWLSSQEIGRAISNATMLNVERYKKSINTCVRKYLYVGGVRTSHFFGQMAHETSNLKGPMVEYGNSMGSKSFEEYDAYFAGPDNYSQFAPSQGYEKYHNTLGNKYLSNGSGDGIKFRGRGSIMMTGRAHYADYWVYRGWIKRSTYDDKWWNKAGWWDDPPVHSIRPAEIPDPQRISARRNGNEYNPIDAGLFFWVNSDSPGKKQINRIVDVESQGKFLAPTVDGVSAVINKYDTPTFGLRRNLVVSAKKELCDAI